MCAGIVRWISLSVYSCRVQKVNPSLALQDLLVLWVNLGPPGTDNPVPVAPPALLDPEEWQLHQVCEVLIALIAMQGMDQVWFVWWMIFVFEWFVLRGQRPWSSWSPRPTRISGICKPCKIPSIEQGTFTSPGLSCLPILYRWELRYKDETTRSDRKERGLLASVFPLLLQPHPPPQKSGGTV